MAAYFERLDRLIAVLVFVSGCFCTWHLVVGFKHCIVIWCVASLWVFVCLYVVVRLLNRWFFFFDGCLLG